MTQAIRPAAAPSLLQSIVLGLLAAFVFTIPFEEIVTIPSIGSITRLLGFLVMGTGIVALVRRNHIVLRRPMAFFAVSLAFVLWNLATYFWSYEPAATIRQFVIYGQLFAFVWLVGEFARTPHRLALLMQAFVLGNYVTFGFTVNTVILQGNLTRDLGRFNANEVAIVAALGIPMAMVLLSRPHGAVTRWVNALYPVLAVATLVLTASRGGFLVGLVALASIPLALVRAKPAVRIALGVLLLATVVAAYEVVPTALPQLQQNLERLAGTSEELTGGTLTGRTVIWQATLDTFWSSPLVGVGAGAPAYALAETALARAVAVHNAFLSVAAGGGLVALLLFMVVFAFAVAGALFTPDGLRPLLLVLALALFVALLPANIEARKFTWFILVLLASHHPIVIGSGVERRDRASRLAVIRRISHDMGEGQR